MGMRRFTRLTDGFSKKVENHAHMVALFFTYYNLCRIHQTLRVTPAMAAKLTGEVDLKAVHALLERNGAGAIRGMRGMGVPARPRSWPRDAAALAGTPAR